jgi:hypothetical protein
VIWWLIGALALVAVLYLAWAISKTASSLPPMQRAQRRFNEVIRAAQASLEPHLTELEGRVTDVQQRAEAMKDARDGGKHRA